MKNKRIWSYENLHSQDHRAVMSRHDMNKLLADLNLESAFLGELVRERSSIPDDYPRNPDRNMNMLLDPTKEQKDRAAVAGADLGLAIKRYGRPDLTEQAFMAMVNSCIRDDDLDLYYDLADIFTDQAVSAWKGI